MFGLFSLLQHQGFAVWRAAGCRALWVGLVVVAGLAGVPLRAELMPAALPGLAEAGVPSYLVLGPEGMGLSSSPIDLHLLPDGRLLVVAAQEIAIGDGVRWETFRGADSVNGRSLFFFYV